MKLSKKLDLMLPLHGERRRRKFAVVDIESKDGETQKGGFTRPFLAGHFDGERFTCFRGKDCINSMLWFLLSPKFDGMTYYAHNGGGFDWLHFLPALAASGFTFEIMTVSSKIQCLRVKPHADSKKKGWTFLDSYQLIPAGLGKISKAFSTEIQKDTNFDYDTEESDARWGEYLESDCVSLYQTLNKFYALVENVIGGEVGMTAAATSMKSYRRGYQKFAIERHSAHHEFFREAYFGGRVEVFRKKAENLHYYDINSSYPHSMLAPMPVGRLVEFFGPPPAWLKRDRIGFARANVCVPETYFPVLAHRTESGRLIFPTGKFSGTWTAVELEKAIELGAHVEWLDSKWIAAKPVFVDYVNTLYALRDKSRADYDESVSYVAKIMMNALYGKFATNTLREKIIFANPGQETPDGSFPADPRNPDCRIFKVEEEIDAPYIAPQIAAYITALSRLHLHSIMTEARALGGVVAYCDTDSVQTDADLSHLCKTGLGGLKDEGAGVLYSGEYLQPKLYLLRGNDGTNKVVMKGYRDRTPEAFAEVKLGGTLSYQSLEKIGGMVKRGFLSPPQMLTITRSLQTEDKKREYLPDGDSRPIVLDN